MDDFSLFEGNLLNRFFARLGMRSRGFFPLAGRFLFLLCLTCFPTAYLAYKEGFTPGMPGPLNFFGDIALVPLALEFGTLPESAERVFKLIKPFVEH